MRRCGGLGVTCGAAALCSLVVASAASAASLTVTVSPAIVHQNGIYTVTIAGRYSRHSLHTTPSLLAFIQYTGSACRATATAEYTLPTREWSWLFYPQRPEAPPPFTLKLHKQTRTRFGQRRVCAYLYPRAIAPNSTDKPLATASAGFRNVKG